MTFGGFGVAYDAAARTLLAQERMADRHAARRGRRQRWRDQLMSHIIQREHQMALLEAIEAQLADPAPQRSGRCCPECKSPCVLVSAAGVDIDTCLDCGGFWFDKGELRALTHRVADIQTQQGAIAPSRFKCPVCERPMLQHRFLTHHDLLVDKCPNDHGVYLERGELIRTLEM